MAKTDHYDVALSFAGEDRKYAEELFRELHQRDVSVFYDNNEAADLWGKNLYDHLSNLYLNRAKYCVMLISRHYVEKMWTNHERQAAQARAVKEKEEYILPVKLDDSDIPGMTHSVAFISWPPETAQSISDKLVYKLRGKTDPPSSPSPPKPIQEKLVFQPDKNSLVEIDVKKAERIERHYKISKFFGWVSGFFFLTGLLGFAGSRKQSDDFIIAGILFLISVVIYLATLPFKKRRLPIAGLFPYKDANITKMGKYMGKSRFARRIGERYAMYNMSMKCAFPDCDGTVYITEPPSEAKKYFSAHCNLDSFVHRYKAASNGIATQILE
jgi:hypothetical protein